MKKSLIAGVLTIALSTIVITSPVGADKSGEPGQTGVVARFDGIGGHLVGPVLTDVGGVELPVLLLVGWDDSVTHCTGGEPVTNGIQQQVTTPSGEIIDVIHNEDIPIMVFDYTDVADMDEFYDLCASGQLQPFATGTAKQRPIIPGDDSEFFVKVKSQGVVTDTAGQDWKLQAFLKIDLADGEPTRLMEWLKLQAI